MFLEKRRKFYFLGLLFAVSVVFCNYVFSYDEEIAHPFLTRNAINLFDQNSENKISDKESEWIIQGAIEEDTPIRWMNHFYNPITSEGLGIFVSSKVWVQSSSLQKTYFLSKGDQTWQKAVNSYAKGDKKEAFIALGHILHLIEDMSVPAHTRGDAHPEGDLYESWAKENGINNISGISPVNFNNLDNYFDNLAGYSNKYFLSKDTIIIINNLQEKIINKRVYLISQDEQDNSFKLVEKKIVFGDVLYNLDNNFIHSDYYSLLAPKAISYGAGVIDLFFKEAEKEKQKLQEKSFFEKLKDLFSNSNTSPASQTAGPGFLLADDVEHSVSNTNTATESEPEPTYPPALTSQGDVGRGDVGSEQSPEQIPAVSQIQHMQDLTNNTEPQLPTPGVGNPTPGIVEPKFSSAGAPYAGFGGGGAPPQMTTVVVYTESTTFANSAETETEATSTEPESEEPEIPADTAPPDISLSVSECANSLATDGCLLATSTPLSIFWSSASDDLDYYEFTHSINSGQAQTSTTTATSTIVSVSDNSTNNFSVRAVDKTGNWSAPQTTTVVVSSMPVVINEVAWAGTSADYSNDEWIELYNRTNYPVNLQNWILYSKTDMGPYINLSGSIPARGYYLMERTDDNTVSDIPADWKGSFGSGLNNSGEILALSYASTTIDQTVFCGAGPTWWCPGFDYKYRTMERKDPDLIGVNSTSWNYNNELIKNGKNSGGQAIYGTPKARNSVNYLIAHGVSSISSDITMTKSKSPYVVNNINQTFQNNATLTIEPGTLIKFYNTASLNFIGNSKIIAQGTAEEPIVFTSFVDDAYGGDLDATSTTPYAGSWLGVNIDTVNNDSVFDHTIFRYGGKYYTSGDYSRANLGIKNSSVNVSNSIFEYSLAYGLKLANSNSNISNNIFRNNNFANDTAGINSAIYISSGGPQIRNNTISQNGRGIYSSGTAVIDSNIINSNAGEAIYSSGMSGIISNNSGSGNNTDGIIFSLASLSATLKPNPLPYILNYSISVASSTTLTIEPGVTIKCGGGYWGGRLDVSGNLLVNGISAGNVIFTSSSASPNPGDWQGIRLYSGSYSNIKGATFGYAEKALVYENSPVNLENVKFENNKLAVQADAGSLLDGVIFNTIEFLDNAATTSPPGLW